MSDRLGGALQRKPLHFVFILDVSGSMLRGGRIQALNNAMAEVVPHLRDEARANPHAELFVRVLTFATETTWVVEEPTPIESFHWERLAATPKGFTELGSALSVLARSLRTMDAGASAYPPALILVSDGRPTDTTGIAFADGLQELLDERWGGAAVRLALGVGRDADMHALRRFIGDEDVPLLRADNPQELVEYVVWASKAASRGASRPVLGAGGVPVTPPTTPGGDPIWSTLG
jgi:uncharacterized protein YegL